MNLLSISSRMPSLPSMPWGNSDLINTAHQAITPFIPRIPLLLEKNRVTLLLSASVLCITALALFFLRKSSKGSEIELKNDSSPRTDIPVSTSTSTKPPLNSSQKEQKGNDNASITSNASSSNSTNLSSSSLEDSQPIDKLWKSYIANFTKVQQSPVIEETSELATIRKDILSKKKENFPILLRTISNDHKFIQSLSLKSLAFKENDLSSNNEDFSQQLLKILQRLITIKLWDCSKETLKEMQSESISPFLKNEVDRRLHTLAQSALFQSKLVDPALEEIASCLEALPNDDLPTMEGYIKAKKLLNFHKNTFSLPELHGLRANCEKDNSSPIAIRCLFIIEELLWNFIGSLSIPELQSLEQSTTDENTKQIITHSLQARQLADSPSSTLPTHYFPIALALAHKPNDPNLISSLIPRIPSKEKKLEPIRQQITFLESIPNKTPFMETRLQAYHYILNPPSLPTPPKATPPPPSPKPKIIIENPLKKLLPLYFLALHKKEDPQAQEHLSEIAKNAKDINPRTLTVDCFSEFKDLSLTDFENLFPLLSRITDVSLKNRVAPYLIELLWEKLSTLSFKDISNHVTGKQQVATPIKQTYHAFLLSQPNASEETILETKDPFSLALAITFPQKHPRKILNTTLEALLRGKAPEEREQLAQVSLQNLKNLSSSSTGLIHHRRAAYELLNKKPAEIKK